MGRSNNINSFVLYMLLIQYLQFVVLFPGGRWQFDFAVFFATFVYICDLHRCLLKLFIFSKFFWYNIHSLGGAIKLF